MEQDCHALETRKMEKRFWPQKRFHYCASDRSRLEVTLGSEMEEERRGAVREATCSQSMEEGRDLPLWKV